MVKRTEGTIAHETGPAQCDTELVGATSLIQSQDELRRKLRRRGFAVTQATLSRDMHELHLFKGAGGYAFTEWKWLDGGGRGRR